MDNKALGSAIVCEGSFVIVEKVAYVRSFACMMTSAYIANCPAYGNNIKPMTPTPSEINSPK